jgi:hypothetical protein
VPNEQPAAALPLPGGSVGGAVRVGDTVRRPTGPWTPAIHALLEHLNRARLDSIPVVLGIDEQDREILTYLPGRSVDVDTETVSDSLLAAAVRWLRRFHEAVRGFRPAGSVRWRNGTRTLAAGQIICHHDPGAYNWIVDGDRLVGMVDWDMAAPGRPIDDLAFMAWSAVPLHRPQPAETVAARLRLMAETYGGVSPAALLGHVEQRMRRATDRIEAGQHRGDSGMLSLAAVGEPARTRRRLSELLDRLPEIESRLATGA